MIKRLKSFFRAPWLCTTISKLIVGLTAAVAVVSYIQEQLAGSEVGDKVNKTLKDVERFLTAALDTLLKASGFVCGSVPTTSSLSIDQAIADLNSISKELGEL